MKKFTLLFMSLFLVLGTVMAQKDEEGPKDFNSPIVYPNSEGLNSIVYNIRMEFSKEVGVTLPEGGIDITNTTTKEVVKIAKGITYDWEPNVAVFEFEQKTVPGKDGKDELQPQYIETAGTYTYTIPAGCIKSTDGEVFEGGTFTFTIVSTFGVANYTPTETDKLEKIDITFEKEIVEVNIPEYGLAIADMYYTNYWYTKNEYTISEDKKTVTVEVQEAITTSGWCDLIIPQGTFVSADGVNAQTTLSINVVDPTPSFSTNYQNGDKVNEIGDLEITFKNVKDFEWTEDAVVELYVPGYLDPIKGKISKSEDGTKLIASFEGDFPEGDGYLYFISAGSFTMDGVANEVVEIEVNLSFLVIETLEVVGVTPEVGTVNEISKIVVMYNQPVRLAEKEYQQISREIQLTCGDKTYTLTYAPDSYSGSASNQIEYLVNAEWTGYEYKSTPITAEGTYTLNLADIIVDYAGESYTDEWGWPNMRWNASGSVEGTYTWTIGEGTGIKAVDTEDSEQVIYDLLGRRVEKIAGAGIYIVNGKKVIVK